MKISSVQTREFLNQKNSESKNNTRYGSVLKDVNSMESSLGVNNPSFKSLGMNVAMPVLNFTGIIMQKIESLGYLMSFLIQDGLGMTLPRVLTGFHRDKDITGNYNIQEGLEVLGREVFSGPYIIGVAPTVLALTTKFCKSTNTNTRLIKKLSSNFKDMISNPKFDKAIQKDSSKFKQEFYRYNIEKIYKDSVPNDKNSNETIKYILSEFEKYESSDKKVANQAHSDIVNKINEKITETSTDLYDVNKLYVNTSGKKTAFNSGEVIRAIKDYAADTITNNPKSDLIEVQNIENIKNNFAAKRFLTNAANIVVTLAGLSILPKIYARSDVSPGAKAMEHMQKNNNKDNTNSPSFKGKGINNDGIVARLGKFLTKHTPDKIHELLEYIGYNFSKTTFVLLSLLGLLLPRGKRAWDRAQIDQNGKRDMTEVNEIAVRDTASSISVVFAVPLMTKALVRSYEDKLGFILTNKASDGKNMFKKALDIINPYSSLDVLSVADLNSIYGNIDSKAKLMNFSKFVNEKGGDLEKILSKSTEKSQIFNEKTFTLESIKNLSKQEKNKKIIGLFESLNDKDSAVKEKIVKLMKGPGDIKHNNIAKFARGLNSFPGFISTMFISPILLGVLIPKLTYYNTKKANAKKINENLNRA